MEERMTAAVVTIYKAGDMTTEGRKRIVQWLRDQAKGLEAEGKDYAPRFTARYNYR